MEQKQEINQKKNNGSKKRAFLVLFLIITLLSIAAACYYYFYARYYQTTDDAFIEGHIVQVSARIPGHIKNILIEDNQEIKKSQAVVELDDSDFQMRVISAQSSLEAAQATTEQFKAMLESAITTMEAADTDLKRYQSLLASGGISQQDYDRIKTKAVAAQADHNTLTKQISAFEAKCSEAKANLQQAQLNLSYTKIAAPVSGKIAKKSVESGEYVQVGQPLCAIVQPDVWIIANFKETQLKHISVGQTAAIRVDAFGGRQFRGHVDSIQAGTGARFSLLPPENATGNYVKIVQRIPVKIVFDEPLENLSGLAVGMSVVPRVKIQ